MQSMFCRRLTDQQTHFLSEWFGTQGREIGTPARMYTTNPNDLVRLVETCARRRLPCYCSVQPYSARGQPSSIEKLFFDFDSKENLSRAWNDAFNFAEMLISHYKILPLIIFSGSKGYHVYIYLKRPISFKPENTDLAKRTLGDIQRRILKGCFLPTLDTSVIGDLKRLARVPFSIHEKSGKWCMPITLSHAPYIPKSLNVFRIWGLDLSLFKIAVETQKQNKKLEEFKTKSKINIPKQNGIRPCIKAALEKRLEGRNGHLMRIAIAREYLTLGMPPTEVAMLFQTQKQDFDFKKSLYYVKYLERNPAKPFKCKTIRELGFCLEEACPIFRKRKGDIKK